MSKVKFLLLRTGIVYHDNGGYNLTISNLPWGSTPYAGRSRGKGDTLRLSNPLAPDALELVVLQKLAGDGT